ncbi:hypothetical protein [Symmachiella macrocystis]|nr:hypothetical protein [Symmachiella macrocystis]
MDVKIALADSEGEVLTRESIWKLFLKGGRELALEWDMLADHEHGAYTALRDAFLDRTTIELLALDGASGVADNEGPRADFHIFTFERTESREDAATLAMSAKPTRTANTPVWYTTTA